MKTLLNKLGISVTHLKCLDEIFRKHSPLYRGIELKMKKELGSALEDISRELYAGGKTRGNAAVPLNRQMILGDVVEYIFSGRAYYYAVNSVENYKNFSKLVLYCVNQLLLYDTITVDPRLRKEYLLKLESKIKPGDLYEKEGDYKLANKLKKSKLVIWQDGWDDYDTFVDSLLPKTLGAPKELVVFTELIRLKIGLVVPLLLSQRLFGEGYAIAPPDFLILGKNKEIFGIELGYKKEMQSREFSLRTSIPTFAVDLADNMHNRCPKCGKNILYCDVIINEYANGTLWSKLDKNGKYSCEDCPKFNNGKCPFSNYYGRYKGRSFYGEQEKGNDKKWLHYHTSCVFNKYYEYIRKRRKIRNYHQKDFFAQYPQIEGIEAFLKR